MKLHTAAIFLFACTLLGLGVALTDYLYYHFKGWSDNIRLLNWIYIVVSLLCSLAILLLAITVKNRGIEDASVKRNGLFLAITAGLVLLFFLSGTGLVIVESVLTYMRPKFYVYLLYLGISLFFSYSLLTLGISIARGKGVGMRRAGLLVLISSVVTGVYLLYAGLFDEFEFDLFRPYVDLFMHMLKIIRVVPLAALALFGLMLYRRRLSAEMPNNGILDDI